MKFAPIKFYKLLKELTLNWLMDPVVLNFASEGVKVSQMDATNTTFIYATVSRDFFEDYKPIGEVVVTKEYAKLIRRVFRGDELVELDVPNRLVLKGSIDVLELEPVSPELANVVKEFKVVRNGEFLLLEKPKVMRAYTVDLSSLADIEAVEKVVFRFSDKLEVVVKESTYKHVRTVPSASVIGSENGEVALYVHVLKNIVSIGGKALLAFTDGPVEVYFKTPVYEALVAVATAVQS